MPDAIIAELKKVEPVLEEAVVKLVDGRTFSCWGWSVRISRTKTSPAPPKSEVPPPAESI